MNRLTLTLLLLSLCVPPLSARAEVEWTQGKKIIMETPPLDVATSADGKWTFVLNKGGKLNIYQAGGKLNDTIPVNPDIDGLSVQGDGSIVFLKNQKESSLTELQIEFVAELDYTGSPFLGNADAPVVIAVFSDFQ